MTLYDHKTGKDISFVCNRIPLIEDGEVIGGVAISTFNEVGEIYNLYSEVEKMQQQNELYQQTIEQLRKQTNPLDYIIGLSGRLTADQVHHCHLRQFRIIHSSYRRNRRWKGSIRQRTASAQQPEHQ